MIEINGKQYLNLEEQVLKNKEDITALQENSNVELGYIELDEQSSKPSDTADIYKNSQGKIVFTQPILAEQGAEGIGGGSGFSQRSIIQGGTYSTGALYSEFTGTVDYNKSARIIQYTTGLTESFYPDQYGDNYIDFDVSGGFNLGSGGVVHGFVSGMSANGSGRVINNVVGNYSDYGYGFGNIHVYIPTGEGIAGGDNISLTLFLGG